MYDLLLSISFIIIIIIHHHRHYHHPQNRVYVEIHYVGIHEFSYAPSPKKKKKPDLLRLTQVVLPKHTGSFPMHSLISIQVDPIWV